MIKKINFNKLFQINYIFEKKQIPCQIIYVNPKKVFVSTYIRSENPNIWLNQDFHSLEDTIIVENSSISLSDIYKKIKFEK